jgi:CHAT domain-containing protein
MRSTKSRAFARFLQAALLVVLFGSIGYLSRPSKAQEPVAIERESDERLATLAERENFITTLLADAEHFVTSKDLVNAARSFNRAGRLQVRVHKPNEALATFREALTLGRELADLPTIVDSNNGAASVLAHQSKCEEATVYLKKASELSERISYLPGHAEALLIQSDCENHSNHALALQTAQRSLGLWQSVSHKWGIGKTLSTIGSYQFSQNDLAAAEKSHTKALAIWRELNIPAEEGEALINLGFIEYRRGAWQRSLELLSQAQGMLDEKAEPFRMGQITGGMAEAFIEVGLPQVGLEKLQQATEYFRLAESPRAQLVMFWDLGKAHMMLGRYDEAIAYLKRGVEGGRNLNEPILGALCDEYLGRTYTAVEDFPTALKHYREALKGFKRISSPMEAARTRALIGQVYQHQGNTRAAHEEYQSALKTFDELSDRLNEAIALYALGTLELEANNLDQAEDYLTRSIDATEGIRRISTSNDLASAFSATVQERYETLVDCYMRKHQLAPDQGFDKRAFETSEFSRARSLSELLRATQTKLVPDIDAKLSLEEQTLRQTLKVKEDEKVALLATRYTPETLAILDAELQRLEARYAEVSELIRSRYPSYEHLDRPKSRQLREVQDSILKDDDTVLLEYILGENRSYVWAVTNKTLTSYELPPKRTINESVQQVYKLLSTNPVGEPAAELNQQLHQLSALVISPIVATLNKRRVIVVADGALNYIPFQSLTATDQEPLIATHEVINAPSASILGDLQLEAIQRRPTKWLVAFGDPVFESNYVARAGSRASSPEVFGESEWHHALRDIQLEGDSFDPEMIKPLFYAKQELTTLSRLAPGDQTLVAGDFEATREKLLSLDLSQFSILHFATHGLLDPKHPEKSGLILSTVSRDGKHQNGFISVQDIYQLRAPVDLVVLSACQTGLGKNVRGEGLIGLTRGFMYAGAASVVASLWKVDDEATAELMKHFYGGMLDKNLTPAAALRDAQNHIRQQPQWRSPYYWAAFTLQGDFNKPIQRPAHSAPTRTVVLIGTLSVLVLIAVAWLLRRRI